MGKIELVSKTKQQITTCLNYTTFISSETRTIATSCCYYFTERGTSASGPNISPNLRLTSWSSPQS